MAQDLSSSRREEKKDFYLRTQHCGPWRSIVDARSLKE